MPDWPILRQSRFGAAKRGEAVDQAIAVITTERGVRRVCAVNAQARARNVRRDLSLADATAICPDLVIWPHDPEQDLAALRALALWAQAFSPLTAADPPDGLWLDITGCAHLFGGEAGLIARLQARLPGARCAIAPTASAAWALARYGTPGSDDLNALPIAALGVDAPTQRRLRRLGLRRIGDLAFLSRGEMLAGCGPDVLARCDRAFGRAPQVLHFLPAPAEQSVSEHHAEPLLSPAQLGGALTRLCADLCARLREARAGMTAVCAQFYRVDARVETLRLGFAAPTCDEGHIGKLLCNGLVQIDPGFGVEMIRLEPTRAPMPDLQHDWLEHTAQNATATAHTLDLLLARAALQRFAPHDSHIPERTVRRVAIGAASSAFLRPTRPRPAVLFARPTAIKVIAEWPDDPPRVIFWRHQRHRVVRADGPERIARDWWRFGAEAAERADDEAGRLRDYYCIETDNGLRLWIFRVGMYAPEGPGGWFIHGVFA